VTAPPPTTASHPVRAALAAALAASLVGVGVAVAQGATERAAYHAVMLAASLALAAGAAGLAVALERRSVAALTLWAAVEAGLTLHPLAAVATVAPVFAAARHGAAQGLRATRLGLLVGASHALALTVAGFATPRLPAGWPEPLTSVLVLAAFLAVGLAVAPRLPPWRTSALLAPAAALVLAGAGLAEWNDRRPRPAPANDAPGPHVFLLVLDTVRADHLSIYGYPRDTTPHLARRVAEHPGARVYPWAFSNGSWTAPSHATLLTGLLPSEHDVHLGTPAAETMDWSLPTRFVLRAERTLAERFAAAGHATLAVFANPWLERIDGLERGFDVFHRPHRRRGLPLAAEQLRRLVAPSWFLEAVHFTPTARDVNRSLVDAVDAARGRNLFVLANYLDTHAPYRPPAAERGRFAPWSPFERPQELAVDLPREELARLAARYDESIRGLDARLDALLEALAARGILENAWVFVTSDHGESFGEHGVTDHGTSVYNDQVRVPLVVLPPRGARLPPVDSPVSLASAATAAAIAGAPLPGDADLRYGGPTGAVVEFYADPSKARSQGRLGGEPAQARVEGTEKLVRYRDRIELFDLASDPDERRDLAGERAARVPGLAEDLPPLGVERAPSAAGTADADPELRRQLEALGYLEEE